MGQQYLNKKQELFCKFIAGGASQIESYELAGYEPSSSNASNLYNKPIIKQRIAELREQEARRQAEFQILAKQAEDADPILAADIAKGIEWSFQRLMDMMAENVRFAQIAGEYKAANDTLKMMGEAMGMFAKASGEPVQQTNMAFIGQITNALEKANKAASRRELEDEEEGPGNPLSPRKD